MEGRGGKKSGESWEDEYESEGKARREGIKEGDWVKESDSEEGGVAPMRERAV